jgi:hypothetical protein
MEPNSENNKPEREVVKVLNFKSMVTLKNSPTPSSQFEISNIFSNVNNESFVFISN